jgi:hypothetical protein
VDAIRELKNGTGRELQVHGSGTLIQTLLENDRTWLAGCRVFHSHSARAPSPGDARARVPDPARNTSTDRSARSPQRGLIGDFRDGGFESLEVRNV